MENAKSFASAFLALAFLACTSTSNSTSNSKVTLTGAWTTYHGDSARDGHPAVSTLDATAAARLRVAWRARLAGAVDGTPAVASGLVITGSEGGDLEAFDASTGHAAWKVTGLGPISASPAVDGDRVLITTLEGHVRAFELRSGHALWDWTAAGDHPAIWSSPAVIGNVVVVGAGSPYGDTPFEPGRMFGLDAASGRLLWSLCTRPGCTPGGGVWSTPSFDSAGVGYVGIGNPDDGVRAFDPATGNVRWQVSLNADAGRDLDVGASPVVLSVAGHETLAVSSVSGLLTLLDAGTGGEMIWNDQLVDGSAVHGLLATPAFDGTRLYAASAGSPNGVFAVTPDDSNVWKHLTSLPVYTAPVVAHGVIAFGTGNVFGDLNAGTLTVLSAADGHQLWSFDTRSAVRCSPAVVGNAIIAGDYAGDVFLFTPSA